MLPNTDDTRIERTTQLIAPVVLMQKLPLSASVANVVFSTRAEAEEIFKGRDDRLLVVTGPCSIHDPIAALEYASRLKECVASLKKELLIVMRVYFEKPRTTVGWKGLINDPRLDNTFDINEGLQIARKLLIGISELGVPAGTEFLDTITPQYIGDLVSWGAIGARTTESQVHRELASGLSAPVGFKNGTGGSIQIAIDAIQAAQHPHHFLSVTKSGDSAIVTTKGHGCCHVILRGSSSGPNYEREEIDSVVSRLVKAQLPPYLMVDCSHGNSFKDHRNQPIVARNLCEQISAGSFSICSVMLESFLVEGNQPLVAGEELRFGQSITDSCMSWEQTTEVLDELAKAVRARRLLKSHTR
ncbi:MAG: 3-deoxy-7-phosphoheptulonate synthase [Verrucomicrobiota bacterium]